MLSKLKPLIISTQFIYHQTSSVHFILECSLQDEVYIYFFSDRCGSFKPFDFILIHRWEVTMIHILNSLTTINCFTLVLWCRSLNVISGLLDLWISRSFKFLLRILTRHDFRRKIFSFQFFCNYCIRKKKVNPSKIFNFFHQ